MTESDEVFSDKSTEELIQLLNKSQLNVANLNAAVYQLKLRADLAEKKLAKAEAKAEHFDVLLKAVKEDEVVRHAWNQFMMTLRLTSGD